VARDRQRAKQRKARRARNPGPAASQPRRENVPGELEHASGEVDEFEAALVAGANGEPETAEPEEAVDAVGVDADESAAVEAEAEPPDGAIAGEEHPEALSDEDFEELEDEVDEVEDEEEQLEERGRRSAGVVATGAVAPGARRPGAAVGRPAQKGPARFLAFLRASWAELQRVQWPDRRQVAQATAVVLGFVVIAGAYLGVADRVASEIVDFII
jgi:preprotein translocase subunit SecE